MTKHDYREAWPAMLAALAEDAAAGLLDPDPAVVARKRREKRAERATATLADAPPARTHSERMAAAAGLRVTGDDLRTGLKERRRIVEHRSSDV
ncbi:MAG: hypothetical protein GY871_09625 [Actinomycetales bacterium]|nr:hypothetical protein [Actinomycetales bacterium]